MAAGSVQEPALLEVRPRRERDPDRADQGPDICLRNALVDNFYIDVRVHFPDGFIETFANHGANTVHIPGQDADFFIHAVDVVVWTNLITFSL